MSLTPRTGYKMANLLKFAKMGIFRTSIITAIVLIALFTKAVAQQYVPMASGSKTELKFTYHKEDQAIKCALTSTKGKITFDPKNLGTASFDITIGTGNLTSSAADWGKNFKNESYFHATKYPTIHLKSTSVTQERVGSIVYTIHGNLTIKGITKPVNIQFIAPPMGTGYIFRAGFDINRLEYDLGTKDDVLDDPVSVFMEIKTEKK